MSEDGEQRIKEGFPGQRSIVLPRPVVSGWLEGRPLIELLPSDVGHYPRAQWHFVERPEGISQWVLIYCTDGGGWARVGSTSLRIRPGQALVAPAGTPHAYGADPDEPWTIYWVHLDGAKVTLLPELLELDPEEPLLHPGRDQPSRRCSRRCCRSLVAAIHRTTCCRRRWLLANSSPIS